MAKTMEEVLERFRTIEFHDDFDMIVAIANGGIVPAGIINQRLQKEVHLLILAQLLAQVFLLHTKIFRSQYCQQLQHDVEIVYYH